MFKIASLLLLAEVYGNALGIPRKTVSSRVFSDSKKLQGLHDGADIVTGRFNAAVMWFSANWPDGAEWPEGVERPAVAEVAE
ncbi:hypothetical protein PZ897_02195 [Hoeflea sp. YIM 152468]|uniref:hypothetical protein n=1 Tax=Hoeflea sp. YIM 152468 TaxID=3031759 RepID=UPI0023D9B0C6|nr:hypothetical protein [Hoeflea sp. YIM 152468]MDF1606981.1 hypothetical protein [Hoeflea sp. YIM 152468]